MRTLKRLAGLVAALTAAAGLVSAQAGPGAVMLEAARQTEVVDGDCVAAMKQYQAVVDQFGKTDRRSAATALVRMAGCHRKVGDDQARATLERVVKEFADQNAIVAEARAELARMASASASPAMRGADPFPTAPLDARVGLYTNVSPDGAYALALSGVQSGDGLLVRNLATGRQRVIVHNSDDGRVASDMVWSPDSRSVAFKWRGDVPGKGRQDWPAELRTVDLSTGQQETLFVFEGSRPPDTALLAWTTAGQIIFSRRAASGVSAGTAVDVLVLPATGGSPRRVFEIDGSWQFGDVTPDGSTAAIVRADHVALVNLTDGSERAVTPGTGAASPRFSRDGKLLAYASKPTGTWALFVVPVARLPIRDVRDAVQLTSLSDVGVADLTNPDVGRLIWKPDDSIELRAQVSEDNIYRVDLDASTAKPSGSVTRLTQDFQGSSPLVSPDHRSIAFLSQHGHEHGLGVMNADGGAERQLVAFRDGEQGELRGWKSPTEVVFWRSSEPASASVANVEARTVAPLDGAGSLPPGPLGRPNWLYLADRQALLVVPGSRQAERRQLRLRPLDGSPDHDLWTSPAFVGHVVASPDGRFVSYPTAGGHVLRSIDDGAEIFRTNQWQILAWSPGCSYFVGRRRTVAPLEIVERATGDSWPLFDPEALGDTLTPAADWTLGFPDWSSDGSFIVGRIETLRTVRSAWQGVTVAAVERILASRR